MAYLTNADIEKRIGTAIYIQLTDDTGSGSADSTRVDETRLGAEGEADSYLACRYRVPVDLSAHPDLAAVLKSFVLDLAEYRLHNRRPPVPDDVIRRHEESIAWFRRLADGGVQLPADTVVIENPALGTLAAIDGPDRMFTRDTLDQT